MLPLIINTFREKIRSKTLYFTGVTGVIILLLITTGDGLSVNGQKILAFEDRVPVIIAINNFLGSLLAIMISLQTIPNEFERKTTHLILSRGIKPWQYMFSMTAGNIFTSLACVFSIYSSMFIFCIALGKGALLLNTLGSILILSVNTALISAVVSLLSIKVPVVINGVLGILLYFLGVFYNTISAAAGILDGFKGAAARTVLYVVPNLAAIQQQASKLLLNQPLDLYPILLQMLYIYIVLSLTFIIFRKEV